MIFYNDGGKGTEEMKNFKEYLLIVALVSKILVWCVGENRNANIRCIYGVVGN